MSSRISPAEQRLVEAILSEGFRLDIQDGWFYPPGGNSSALVRLSVYGGQYQLHRRRKLKEPWMIVVTRDAEEFDIQSFHSWRETWPLTA